MNDKMTWLVEYLRRNGAMSAEEVIQEAADALDVQAGSIEAVQAVNTRQAERIEALEGQLDDATAAARSDQMIAETAQAAAARLLTERDELRAQLAEIENVEPVIWAISYDGVTPYTLWHEGDGPLLDCEVKRQGGTTQKMPLFTAAPAPQTEEPVATDNMNHPLRTWKDPLSAWWHCRSNWGIGGIGLSEAEAITNWADENPKEVTRLGLFTRTMPVQPIIGLQAIHDAITVDPTLADCSQDMNAELVEAEPVAIALNTGTRQAVKWLQNIPHGEKLYTRPMPVQSAEHCLWARNGHEPCQHVKPMQDVTELVEALEKLARLGNGEHYGNSNGNMIARDALSKYKGAK